MVDIQRLVYLHGSDSDSNSGKARLFREWFPGMLTPDFMGSFEARMHQLYAILADETDWTLIGSSYGGLMAVIFALEHPAQVRKLVLLAPALLLEPLASLAALEPLSIPAIVIHGALDTVVPLEPVRTVVQKLFSNVKYYVVEDGHRLSKSVHELDWNSILE